jgi:hypothetical protein
MFPSKLKKKLKQQLSSSTTQYNGQVGMQCQTYRHIRDLPMPYTNKTKNRRKKKDSVEAGMNYEHWRANGYTEQQHRNSNIPTRPYTYRIH